MFVVERVYAVAEIRGQDEIDSIVDALATAGFQPALRSMTAAAAKVATLGGRRLGVGVLVNREPRFRTSTTHVDAPIGDLMFAVTEGIADRCYFVQPFSNRLFVFELRHHCVPSRLTEFCAAVERAVRARLDGRRVRGMDFSWAAVKEPIARQVPGSSRFPDAELKTKKPEYSEDELRAARLLVGAEARSFLLQLAQIGKVRAADAKLPPALIESLLGEHLLSKEYLVLCRKDSRTLCQVTNVEDLNVVSGGKLVCATCGRKFGEELVHEIFAGTDSSKQLVTSSRWMTIWLTDLLIQAGLAKEKIVWSATAGDDEIDIMTDELGLRILFELKDREFGLGDAYPFAYRLDRYGGNLGIVVSTDKIAQEAEKFFHEQRSKSAASIETLAAERIETGVRDLVDKYSRAGAQRVLNNLSVPLGINIGPLVSNWMDMFATAFRGGHYKSVAPAVQAPLEPVQLAKIGTENALATIGAE
jgi:hypothetical protein